MLCFDSRGVESGIDKEVLTGRSVVDKEALLDGSAEVEGPTVLKCGNEVEPFSGVATESVTLLVPSGAEVELLETDRTETGPTIAEVELPETRAVVIATRDEAAALVVGEYTLEEDNALLLDKDAMLVVLVTVTRSVTVEVVVVSARVTVRTGEIELESIVDTMVFALPLIIVAIVL